MKGYWSLKPVYLMLTVLVLLTLGCVSNELKYTSREELPTEITITKLPEPSELGTPFEIECKDASCGVVAKQYVQKNRKWDCFPKMKVANNDPMGTSYVEREGGYCEPLPTADILCFDYECNDAQKLEGYYSVVQPCQGYLGIGVGVSLPVASKNGGAACGSIGNGYYLSAISNEFRGGTYEILKCENMFECSFTCKEAISCDGTYKVCPAEMPIIYPYNAMHFAYNPIVSPGDTPSSVIRNLLKDYKLIGTGSSISTEKQLTEPPERNEGESASFGFPECEDVCKDIKNAQDSERCRK
jgi:hypothetical protein